MADLAILFFKIEPLGNVNDEAICCIVDVVFKKVKIVRILPNKM
tara:strand:+ start:844 stop:975 length:132 start_codon:yes stop_codon:yes gene_type:complete